MTDIRVSDALRFDDRGVLVEDAAALPWWAWLRRRRRRSDRARATVIQAGVPPWLLLPKGSDPITFSGQWGAAAGLDMPASVRVHWIPNHAGIWVEMRKRPDGGFDTVPFPGFGPTRGAKFWDVVTWSPPPGYALVRLAWAARQDLELEVIEHGCPAPLTGPVAGPVTIRVRLKAPEWNPRIHLAMWSIPIVRP